MPSPYRSLQLQRDRLPVEWQSQCANLMKLAEMLRAHFPYSYLHIFERTTRENRHQMLEHSRNYVSRARQSKSKGEDGEETPLLPGSHAEGGDCPLVTYSSSSSSSTPAAISLALPPCSSSTSGPSFLSVPSSLPSSSSSSSKPKKGVLSPSASACPISSSESAPHYELPPLSSTAASRLSFSSSCASRPTPSSSSSSSRASFSHLLSSSSSSATPASSSSPSSSSSPPPPHSPSSFLKPEQLSLALPIFDEDENSTHNHNINNINNNSNSNDIHKASSAPTLQKSSFLSALTQHKRNIVRRYSDPPHPLQPAQPSEKQRYQNLLDFVAEIERQQNIALSLYRVQAAQIATELPLLQDQAATLKKVPGSPVSIHHKSLKVSLVVLYRRATMLFNFMVFHRTVFDVFIAEYDRLLLLSSSGYTVKEVSLSCEVFETQLEELGQCDDLIQDCQSIVACYADVFENGNAIQGKMQLIARMTDRPQDSALSFRLGFKNGVTLVLFLFAIKAIVFDAHMLVPIPSAHSTAAFKTYRFVFGIMIFVWLWGCNVWIWTHYRVNFVHIFQFDPRTRLTHRDIWSEASNLTIIFFLNLMAYITCRSRGWESGDYLFSTGLFLWFLAKGVLPWPFSKWKTRRYFLRRFLNTVTAPWSPCAFSDVYFGDVLTSMNKLFVDFFTAICFLLSTPEKRISGQLVGTNIKWLVVPILAGLPFFWRFSQCINRFWETGDRWPHLANAGKYLTAHTVTIMGAFHTFLSHSGNWNQFRTMWLFASLLSATYAFVWDVTMDWGLCRGKGIHFLLREHRSYPTHWYYFAIFSNLFLRLSWTLTILPFSSNPYWVSDSAYDIYMSPVLIFLELFRRFQWGVFRVDCAQTYDQEFGNNLNVPLLFGLDEVYHPKPKSRRPPSIIFEVAGIFCLFLLLGIVVAR